MTKSKGNKSLLIGEAVAVAPNDNSPAAFSRAATEPTVDVIAEPIIDSDLPVPKCARRGCRAPEGEQLLFCKSVNCRKLFHLSCYEERYGEKNWDETIGHGNVVCTKACFDKVKSISARKLTWKDDGKNGPEDPNNSEKLLLDWLLKAGNYSLKWKGKKNGGKTKTQIAEMIATTINSTGVKEPRNAKQIMNKIEHLERQFKAAHDFANTETGAGLEENDIGSFDEAVQKHCSMYYDLLPIMGERASAKPKALSHDGLESSEDEATVAEVEDAEEDDEPFNAEDSSITEDTEKSSGKKKKTQQRFYLSQEKRRSHCEHFRIDGRNDGCSRHVKA